MQLPTDQTWGCHVAAKTELIEHVKSVTDVQLERDVATLGFARRMAGCKRPLLLFSDADRLAAIAAEHRFQIVLAGKAHPKDEEGKAAIHRLVQLTKELRGRITCVFLPNYDMQLAQIMVSGVDVW
jgi:glycogen phosphorylase